MKEVYEKECGSRLYYKNLEKRLFSMKVSCLITILIEYTWIKKSFSFNTQKKINFI